MKYWFTSDTHFFHKNILKYSKETRPSNSLDEMHEQLIDKWNTLVSKGDQVYHLGDFSFAGVEKTIPIIKQLSGDIHLIKGNHDNFARNREAKKLFASVQDYKKIRIGKERFVMFHFPILEWENMHHGSIHLFGHAHQAYKSIGGKSLNVGIDTRDDYGLYSLEEVMDFMADKPVLNRPEAIDVQRLNR